MAYRFVVETAYGLQNILKIKNRDNGDVIVTSKGRVETIDLDNSNHSSTEPENLHNLEITIHPNLQSSNATISINYKKKKNGGSEQRTVVHALEVRKGLKLFPVLTTAGGNLASASRLLAKNTASDECINLWPGQKFDWSLQSFAYCLFVANKDISFVHPHNFPRELICLPFNQLQIILMYWSIDLPTKGASISLELKNPNDGALPGLDINQAIDVANQVTTAYENAYSGLPYFHPKQLPTDTIPQSGVKIVNNRWLFKDFSWSIETHRDQSLLRLSFRRPDGEEAVLDLRSASIAQFRDQLNKAIQVVPGLIEWGPPSSPSSA